MTPFRPPRTGYTIISITAAMRELTADLPRVIKPPMDNDTIPLTELVKDLCNIMRSSIIIP